MTKEQAMITLKQLTGRNNPINTLVAMIGASNFSVGESGVSFKFKMCSWANCCTINLNSHDLYDMSFTKIRGFKINEMKKFEDIFWDNLKSVFENETRLRLTL